MSFIQLLPNLYIPSLPPSPSLSLSLSLSPTSISSYSSFKLFVYFAPLRWGKVLSSYGICKTKIWHGINSLPSGIISLIALLPSPSSLSPSSITISSCCSHSHSFLLSIFLSLSFSFTFYIFVPCLFLSLNLSFFLALLFCTSLLYGTVVCDSRWEGRSEAKGGRSR